MSERTSCFCAASQAAAMLKPNLRSAAGSFRKWFWGPRKLRARPHAAAHLSETIGDPASLQASRHLSWGIQAVSTGSLISHRLSEESM